MYKYGDIVDFNSEDKGSGTASVIEERNGLLIVERLFSDKDERSGDVVFALDIKKDCAHITSLDANEINSRKQYRGPAFHSTR